MSGKENSIKTTANTLTIRLYVEMIKEGEYFVAHCPALELSSYGKDEETAKKRFGEELEIFFEETLQKGTLEKYLLKMGWTLRKRPVPEYTPPENNTKVPSSFIKLGRKSVIMATYTITINERMAEGKRLVGLLRSSKAVASLKKSGSIPDLEEALEDVREGRVNTYTSVDELMTALKKKAGVHDTNNQ